MIIKREERNSSIELLKLIAIFLIVINHVTQTATTTNSAYLGIMEHAVEIGLATSDINKILLIIFRHFGAFGNAVFMICSSWFLCEKTVVQGKKVVKWVLDVWAISVLLLVVFHMGGGTNMQ